MFEKRYYSNLSELGEIKEGDLVTKDIAKIERGQ